MYKYNIKKGESNLIKKKQNKTQSVCNLVHKMSTGLQMNEYIAVVSISDVAISHNVGQLLLQNSS